MSDWGADVYESWQAATDHIATEETRGLVRVLTYVGRSANLSLRLQSRYAYGGRIQHPESLVNAAFRCFSAAGGREVETARSALKLLAALDAEPGFDCSEFVVAMAAAIETDWDSRNPRCAYLANPVDHVATDTLDAILLTKARDAPGLVNDLLSRTGILELTLRQTLFRPWPEVEWKGVTGQLEVGDIIVATRESGTGAHTEFVVYDERTPAGFVATCGLRGATLPGLLLVRPDRLVAAYRVQQH